MTETANIQAETEIVTEAVAEEIEQSGAERIAQIEEEMKSQKEMFDQFNSIFKLKPKRMAKVLNIDKEKAKVFLKEFKKNSKAQRPYKGFAKKK